MEMLLAIMFAAIAVLSLVGNLILIRQLNKWIEYANSLNETLDLFLDDMRNT